MKFFYATCGLLFSINASAQTDLKEAEALWQQNTKEIVITTNNSQAKTTAIKQRLIGQSYYRDQGNGYEVTDSTDYHYSGQRSSFFDLNYMDFMPQHLQYDSSIVYKNPGGPDPFSPIGQRLVKYNSAGDMAERVIKPYTNGSYINSNRSVTLYNSQNMPTVIVQMKWVPQLNQWDTTGKTVMLYDAQGSNIADSTYNYLPAWGIWQPQSADIKTYDPNGNLLIFTHAVAMGGAWSTPFRYTYTYNTNGKLLVTVFQTINNGNWQNHSMQSFTYTAGVDFFVAEERSIWQNGAWLPQVKNDKKLNAQGLPDTTSRYQWNAANNTWDLDYEFVWSFNSFNNPESASTNSGSSMAEAFFYYEQYSTGVDDIEKSMFTVYPNPANDIVSIMSDKIIARVWVMNTLGQTVSELQINSKNASISLGALRAGIYLINATDKDGGIITKQIVKQ